MNKTQIQKYLKFLKVKEKFKVENLRCEICGSNKKKIFQKKTNWNNNNFGILPVVCCLNCGFLYQNPRFEKKFYTKFYKEFYRRVNYGTSIPSKKFIKDQKFRGKKIFNFISKNFKLKKKGSVIDVGCSCGLMLLPFLKKDWKVQGFDPERIYVNYGKENYNLPIETKCAEEMILKKNSLDLILILGSLEHCYDPNKTLKICSEAAKNDSLIVLEGRGYPRSTAKYYFNHNHHRYFSINSFELILMKHGWEPILSTYYPISGPTRKGTNWVIGRFKGKNKFKNIFKKMIKNGKRETFETIKHHFKFYEKINKNVNPNNDYLSQKKKNSL